MIHRFAGVATLALVTFTACGDRAPQENAPGDAPASSQADSVAGRAAPPAESAATPPVPTTLDEATRIAVEIREWQLRMPDDTIKAGDYAFVLNNRGERAHAIEIRSDSGARWRSLSIAPGTSVVLSMPLSPGSYQIESADSAYAARGIRTTFVVIDDR